MPVTKGDAWRRILSPEECALRIDHRKRGEPKLPAGPMRNYQRPRRNATPAQLASEDRWEEIWQEKFALPDEGITSTPQSTLRGD